MALTRRQFLQAGAASSSSVALAPWMPTQAASAHANTHAHDHSRRVSQLDSAKRPIWPRQIISQPRQPTQQSGWRGLVFGFSLQQRNTRRMNMKNLSRRQFIFGASALALLPAASWAHTHSHGGHGEGHHHGHSNHGGHGSHGNHGHQGHQHHPHMDHSEPNMISLNPRQRGAVIWHFDQPGTYYYGCLEPGHYEAGMIGKIIVSN